MRDSNVIVVSVIMAAKNEESYISTAIHSILNQSFEKFELLVVDDGSTDGTTSIVESFSAKDSRVILLKGEGCGPAGARQLAVSVARGEYILIMDADDVVPNHRIDELLMLAEGHERVMIGSNVKLMRVDETIVGEIDYPTSNDEIRAGFSRLWNRSVMMPGTILASSCLYREYPYNKNFKYLEDWDFVLRVSDDKTVHFANSDKYLYYYRLKPNSVSMNWRLRNQYNALLIENQIRRRHGVDEIHSLEELYLECRTNFAVMARFVLIVFAKYFQHNIWRYKMKRLLGI